MNLDKSKWERVKFGDVVRLNTERCADPAAAGIERYVGLEHIDPDDLRLRRWGLVAEGTTFTNRFRPGQVLFGKRRAYQRKVAVADFGGVCSSDIYVFEPKDCSLLPELLPFICQGEAFYSHSISTSAGSLSPRTNWAQLANFEFSLPPKETQRRLAVLLTAATDQLRMVYELVAAAKICHRAYIDNYLHSSNADELVRVYSHELAGGWTCQTIDQICQNIVDCLHRTPTYINHGYPAIRTADIEPGILNWQTAQRVSRADYDIQTSRLLPKTGDILFSREGERMGMAAQVPAGVELCISQRMVHLRPRDDFPANLVMEYLNSSYVQRQIRARVSGSTSPHLNVRDVKNLIVPIPPQEDLENFSRRAQLLMNGYMSARVRLSNAQEFVKSLYLENPM
jgi:type I restriction enzyme S subunit